jgi:hypothetical protein
MAKLTDINLLDVGHTIMMTGAIFSGNDKHYLCFFPFDREDHPTEPLEMNHEDWKTFIRQTDILETEVLQSAPDGTLAKVILRKSARVVDSLVQWRVFKRDGYACRYCGNDNVPLSVDHLVVWEDGGPTIETNLVAACKKCNKVRGNLSYAEWLRHPRYKNVSTNLTPEARAANEALLGTLDAIPRMVNKRTR